MSSPSHKRLHFTQPYRSELFCFMVWSIFRSSGTHTSIYSLSITHIDYYYYNQLVNNRETIDFKTLHYKNDIFTEILLIFELVSWYFIKITLNYFVYSLHCRLLTKIIYKNIDFLWKCHPKGNNLLVNHCVRHTFCVVYRLLSLLMLCLSSIRMNFKLT